MEAQEDHDDMPPYSFREYAEPSDIAAIATKSVGLGGAAAWAAPAVVSVVSGGLGVGAGLVVGAAAGACVAVASAKLFKTAAEERARDYFYSRNKSRFQQTSSAGVQKKERPKPTRGSGQTLRPGAPIPKLGGSNTLAQSRGRLTGANRGATVFALKEQDILPDDVIKRIVPHVPYE